MHGFSERSEPRENFEHFKYKVNFNKKTDFHGNRDAYFDQKWHQNHR